MAKEEPLKFEGKVINILWDKVSIEMTPYDLTMGRITFRHK